MTDPRAFTYVAPRVDRRSGKPMARRYVVPCWFLDLNLRFTDDASLRTFHRAVCAMLGDRFTHHAGARTPRVVRARDRAAALGAFEAFLDSDQTHTWQVLTDVGAKDGAVEPGGVGAASLSYWLHRTPASERAAQVARYREHLAAWGTDMLAFGVTVSHVQVCWPLDHFATAAELAACVTGLVAMPFFSATAGIKLRLDPAVPDAEASARLLAWLRDFPGLDHDPGLGNRMGRVLRADGTDVVPVLKRPSFLTFVSNDARDLLAPPDVAGCRTHALPHGFAIQAGDAVALAPTDPGFELLFAVGRALSPLALRPHPRDLLTPDHAAVSAWLYALWPPGTPP